MGQIYVIGGGRQSSVEIYDPLRDSWEQGQSLPGTMYLEHVTIFQDQVYYIGGRRVYSMSDTPNTEVFTFMGGSWQVVPGVSVEDYSRSEFPAPIVNTDVLFTPTGSSSTKKQPLFNHYSVPLARFLYLSDTHIIDLHEFTTLPCQLSYPNTGTRNAVAGLVATAEGEKLVVCKTGCHMLTGGVWLESNAFFDR